MENDQSPEYQSLLQATFKDRIYTTAEADAFAFGDQVAEVFDDMISRSVPFYLDLQLLAASVAVKFYKSDTKIYDLGCSTATTLALIAKRLPNVNGLIGIDSSVPMLEKAAKKIANLKIKDQITLINASLVADDEDDKGLSLEPASVFLANYTLQFLPIAERKILLKKIFNALIPEGAFLVSEKTIPIQENEEIIRTLHEDFKHQNGYSLIEIAKKRDSLVGVMRPITEKANLELFFEAGFTQVIEVMRGYSFVSWVCIK